MAQNRKKVIKKNETNEEIKKTVKLITIVLLIIIAVYFLTGYASKNGKFSSDYVPLDTPEAVMTYEEATIGTVFNRSDKEYYVIFEDFGNENKTFITSLINTYINNEKHLPIYKVDMSLDVNKKFKSNTSNKYAKSSNELKIKTPTLIMIKDGHIEKYIEGNDKIKSELN